jgi:hypothetical protein
MSQIDDKIRKYIKATSHPQQKGVVVKAAGRNANGCERIILFVTAGIKLNDIWVFAQHKDESDYSFIYRFDEKKFIEEDCFVCLYTGTVNYRTIINGEKILSYCMGAERNLLCESDTISVGKFDILSEFKV